MAATASLDSSHLIGIRQHPVCEVYACARRVCTVGLGNCDKSPPDGHALAAQHHLVHALGLIALLQPLQGCRVPDCHVSCSLRPLLLRQLALAQPLLLHLCRIGEVCRLQQIVHGTAQEQESAPWPNERLARLAHRETVPDGSIACCTQCILPPTLLALQSLPSSSFHMKPWSGRGQSVDAGSARVSGVAPCHLEARLTCQLLSQHLHPL